jgi:hypothetical protein
MSGWRVMKSAPTDGTEILLHGVFEGELYSPALRPQTRVVAKTTPTGPWYLSDVQGYAVWATKAIAWKPLPAPPTEGETTDA